MRSVSMNGPAGRLEGLLNEGASSARCAVLLCHPHPLGGGSFHNKVVYHAMKVFNDPAWGFGLPVLRFNFRGVGTSAGVHDGLAESQDVLAALDWLEREYRLPVVLAGYSFGAAMALKACSELADRQTAGVSPLPLPVALVLIGLPVSNEFPELQRLSGTRCSIPKLYLSGESDQYAPRQEIENAVASAAEPKRLMLVPGADHFFTGQQNVLQKTLAGCLKEYLP